VGKTGAAPAPEAGGLHLSDDLLRGHLQKRFARPKITIPGDVVVDHFRIDHSLVAQDQGFLLREKRDIHQKRYALLSVRILEHEPLKGLPVDQVLLHDGDRVIGFDLLVKDAVGLDHHDGTLGANSLQPVSTT